MTITNNIYSHMLLNVWGSGKTSENSVNSPYISSFHLDMLFMGYVFVIYLKACCSIFSFGSKHC